jgi:hypothetical protein
MLQYSNFDANKINEVFQSLDAPAARDSDG